MSEPIEIACVGNRKLLVSEEGEYCVIRIVKRKLDIARLILDKQNAGKLAYILSYWKLRK